MLSRSSQGGGREQPVLLDLSRFLSEPSFVGVRVFWWIFFRRKVNQSVFFEHVQNEIVTLMRTLFFPFESNPFQTSLLVLDAVVPLCRCEFGFDGFVRFMHLVLEIRRQKSLCLENEAPHGCKSSLVRHHGTSKKGCDLIIRWGLSRLACCKRKSS